jgi:hypothetical protein
MVQVHTLTQLYFYLISGTSFYVKVDDQGNRMSARFLLTMNDLNAESLSIIHEVMEY